MQERCTALQRAAMPLPKTRRQRGGKSIQPYSILRLVNFQSFMEEAALRRVVAVRLVRRRRAEDRRQARQEEQPEERRGARVRLGLHQVRRREDPTVVPASSGLVLQGQEGSLAAALKLVLSLRPALKKRRPLLLGFGLFSRWRGQRRARKGAGATC